LYSNFDGILSNIIDFEVIMEKEDIEMMKPIAVRVIESIVGTVLIVTGVAFVFCFFILTIGDPDIIDGIIHWLMKG